MPVLRQIVLDELNQREVALVAGRVERDETRQQFRRRVVGAAHEWSLSVPRAASLGGQFRLSWHGPSEKSKLAPAVSNGKIEAVVLQSGGTVVAAAGRSLLKEVCTAGRNALVRLAAGRVCYR